MPKYSMTLAASIRMYGEIEIEADTPEAAIEKVRAATGTPDCPFLTNCNDADRTNATEQTILNVGLSGNPFVQHYCDIDLTVEDAPFHIIDGKQLEDRLREFNEFNARNAGETP